MNVNIIFKAFTTCEFKRYSRVNHVINVCKIQIQVDELLACSRRHDDGDDKILPEMSATRVSLALILCLGIGYMDLYGVCDVKKRVRRALF